MLRPSGDIATCVATPVPPPGGPPKDVLSGATIVNCTGPAGDVPSAARRSAITAAAISAMADTAATSQMNRLERAGGATVDAAAPSLDPDATHLRSRNRSRAV